MFCCVRGNRESPVKGPLRSLETTIRLPEPPRRYLCPWLLCPFTLISLVLRLIISSIHFPRKVAGVELPRKPERWAEKDLIRHA